MKFLEKSFPSKFLKKKLHVTPVRNESRAPLELRPSLWRETVPRLSCTLLLPSFLFGGSLCAQARRSAQQTHHNAIMGYICKGETMSCSRGAHPSLCCPVLHWAFCEEGSSQQSNGERQAQLQGKKTDRQPERLPGRVVQCSATCCSIQQSKDKSGRCLPSGMVTIPSPAFLARSLACALPLLRASPVCSEDPSDFWPGIVLKQELSGAVRRKQVGKTLGWLSFPTPRKLLIKESLNDCRPLPASLPADRTPLRCPIPQGHGQKRKVPITTKWQVCEQKDEGGHDSSVPVLEGGRGGMATGTCDLETAQLWRVLAGKICRFPQLVEHINFITPVSQPQRTTTEEKILQPTEKRFELWHLTQISFPDEFCSPFSEQCFRGRERELGLLPKGHPCRVNPIMQVPGSRSPLLWVTFTASFWRGCCSQWLYLNSELSLQGKVSITPSWRSKPEEDGGKIPSHHCKVLQSFSTCEQRVRLVHSLGQLQEWSWKLKMRSPQKNTWPESPLFLVQLPQPTSLGVFHANCICDRSTPTQETVVYAQPSITRGLGLGHFQKLALFHLPAIEKWKMVSSPQ
ncbi:hypothetical protein L345_05513, partial [Ophiophagus hannah]